MKQINGDTWEITHFCLFSGMGGLPLGMNRGHARVGRARTRMRCLGGVDNWPVAIANFNRLVGTKGTVLDLFDRRDYEAFHGKAPPAGWREATPADLRAAAGGECPDIVATSPPCLPADGVVLTDRGPRAISTIRPGDHVLTHQGRFRPVREVGRHEYRGPMHGFRLNGTVDLQWFTTEHPMWVRRVERSTANGKVCQLGSPTFIAAGSVRIGDRIGFPVDLEVGGTAQRFVRYHAPDMEGRGAERVVQLGFAAEAEALWFLLGAYVGDGYRRESRHEVIYCVGPEGGRKFTEITSRLADLGLAWNVDRYGGMGNVKVRVHAKHLSALCGAFGDGAESKDLPVELFGLESRCLGAFIAGYRATDGNSRPRRTPPGGNELQAGWKIVSVSLPMLRSVQRLLLRLGLFGGINVAAPAGESIIEGRTVQTLPRWEIVIREDYKKRATFEFIDGAVWTRVRQIERHETVEEVWNLDVAVDDTFCAPMMATHNCKGFSGLLNPKVAASPKYQALNNLVIRGLQLMLAAFADDPPAFILLENVPRIQQRGRQLLDDVEGLLRAHGYAVAETTHDCGELGALSQRRPRFLLVARNVRKVRPFLYVPPKSRVRSIGEALARLPLPEDPRAGSMHRLPRLQWQTWLRLALIEAGKDWRSLERFAVQDGQLRDVGLLPLQAEWHHGSYGVRGWDQAAAAVTTGGGPSTGPQSVADPRVSFAGRNDLLGVRPWDRPARTVAGRADPTNGAHSVADPRFAPDAFSTFQPYSVVPWNKPAGTVTAQAAPGSGPYTVADPRPAEGKGPSFANIYRLIRWGEPCNAVTGAVRPAGGAASVADPRLEAYGLHSGKLLVQDWDDAARTVTGSDRVGSGAQVVADPRGLEIGQYSGKMRIRPWDTPAGTITTDTDVQAGAQCIADPRPTWDRQKGDDWDSGGHYGVLDWQQQANAVVAHAKHDNGFFSVADPRPATEGLPAPTDCPDPVPLIVSLDDTWHRPLTTLELAHLQGFPVFDGDGRPMDLEGSSVQVLRELIGNAVPPPTAEAIGRTIGETMLAEVLGETFRLDALPIWVQPLGVALSMLSFGEG